MPCFPSKGLVYRNLVIRHTDAFCTANFRVPNNTKLCVQTRSPYPLDAAPASTPEPAAVTSSAIGLLRNIGFDRRRWRGRYQLSGEELPNLARENARPLPSPLAEGASKLPVDHGTAKVEGAVGPDTRSGIRAAVAHQPALYSNRVRCTARTSEDRRHHAVGSWGIVWRAPAVAIHDTSIFCDVPGGTCRAA